VLFSAFFVIFRSFSVAPSPLEEAKLCHFLLIFDLFSVPPPPGKFSADAHACINKIFVSRFFLTRLGCREI